LETVAGTGVLPVAVTGVGATGFTVGVGADTAGLGASIAAFAAGAVGTWRGAAPALNPIWFPERSRLVITSGVVVSSGMKTGASGKASASTLAVSLSDISMRSNMYPRLNRENGIGFPDVSTSSSMYGGSTPGSTLVFAR
jgi:hypothetical protein